MVKKRTQKKKKTANSVFDISCCERDENSCAWESIVSAKVGEIGENKACVTFPR